MEHKYKRAYMHSPIPIRLEYRETGNQGDTTGREGYIRQRRRLGSMATARRGRGGGGREEWEAEISLYSRAALWKWAEGFCMTSSIHRPAEVSVEVCRK